MEFLDGKFGIDCDFIHSLLSYNDKLIHRAAWRETADYARIVR